MAVEEIRTALEELGQRFGDRRDHYFEVEVGAVEDGVCRLVGSVLDEETLATLQAELAGQFAAVRLDMAQVNTLRRQPPQMMTVATNLMSLKGQPATGSETLSQLRAGETVERLLLEEKWAFVRQQDGYLGWAYVPYLSDPSLGAPDMAQKPPPPSHLVARPVALLRAEPASNSPLVTRLVAGTAVTVEDHQEGSWARVAAGGFSPGWLPLAALRARDALPATAPARRAQMVSDAYDYTGVPYLWGGVSALGIDCSGYAQLLHHLSGVTIPRDADMQWRAGEPVEPPFAAGDLLFFGSGRGHRPISHVGMSLGGWRMIHASGPRNGVYVDDVQAAGWLGDIFVSARSFLSGAD